MSSYVLAVKLKMGNLCGLVAVKEVVTLGGRRHEEKCHEKVYKIKQETRKPASKEKLKNGNTNKITLSTKKERSTNKTKDTEKAKIVESSVTCKLGTQKKNIEVKGYQKLKRESALKRDSEKGLRVKDVQKSKRIKPCKKGRERRKHRVTACKALSPELSSNFSTSLSKDCTDQKVSTSDNFLMEWQKEEKRLQNERENIEDRIRSLIRDEYIAKAETQTWRTKLDKLSLQHRVRLVKQAQVLKQKLKDVEALKAYHELRAERLHAKNANMKELIESVKQEAQELRIKNMNKREAARNAFNEKLSTVEHQLLLLHDKLNHTKNKGLLTAQSVSHKNPTKTQHVIALPSIVHVPVSSVQQTWQQKSGHCNSNGCGSYSRYCQPRFNARAAKTKQSLYFGRPKTDTNLIGKRNNTYVMPKRVDCQAPQRNINIPHQLKTESYKREVPNCSLTGLSHEKKCEVRYKRSCNISAYSIPSPSGSICFYNSTAAEKPHSIKRVQPSSQSSGVYSTISDVCSNEIHHELESLKQLNRAKPCYAASSQMKMTGNQSNSQSSPFSKSNTPPHAVLVNSGCSNAGSRKDDISSESFLLSHLSQLSAMSIISNNTEKDESASEDSWNNSGSSSTLLRLFQSRCASTEVSFTKENPIKFVNDSKDVTSSYQNFVYPAL